MFPYAHWKPMFPWDNEREQRPKMDELCFWVESSSDEPMRFAVMANQWFWIKNFLNIVLVIVWSFYDCLLIVVSETGKWDFSCHL